MLQLHLSVQQFYCLLRCVPYTYIICLTAYNLRGYLWWVIGVPGTRGSNINNIQFDFVSFVGYFGTLSTSVYTITRAPVNRCHTLPTPTQPWFIFVFTKLVCCAVLYRDFMKTSLHGKAFLIFDSLKEEYTGDSQTHVLQNFDIFFTIKGSSEPGSMQRDSQTQTLYFMMTSSNGNIFRVTGHLCGEFTRPRWNPHKKASDAELWCFHWSASGWTVEETIMRLVIWDAIAPIMTSL